MKKWENPVIAELNISETANGNNNAFNESAYTNDNAQSVGEAFGGYVNAFIDHVNDVLTPDSTS